MAASCNLLFPVNSIIFVAMPVCCGVTLPIQLPVFCMAFTEVLCPYNLLSMFGSARHIIKPERGIARGLIQQQFQNDLMI